MKPPEGHKGISHIEMEIFARALHASCPGSFRPWDSLSRDEMRRYRSRAKSMIYFVDRGHRHGLYELDSSPKLE